MKEISLSLLNEEIFSPQDVFSQISNLIYAFNLQHPNEMLPKTPNELQTIYQSGLSVIAIDPQRKKVIGHAALYPLLDTFIEGTHLRLLEFGSWIVVPEYRHCRINGLTIGEQIAQELIHKYPNLPIIATVKRKNSLCGLNRIGFEMVEFDEFPFIAALTCVCGNSSEHFGHQCHYRKRENHVNPLYNTHMLNNSNSSIIPCTLLGYNLDVLRELNIVLEGLIMPSIQTAPTNLRGIFQATRNFLISIMILIQYYDINIV